MADLNKAVVMYLSTCPQVASNPLFFNAINAKDNDKQLVTVASSTASNKPYIDGSVEKKFTFTIIDFRSVVYQPVVKIPGYSNENLDEMLDVQAIIDWISEQNDKRNFPDFGENAIIDSISATSNTPNLNGIDTSVTPALAKYSISIQITYIDTTKQLWS